MITLEQVQQLENKVREVVQLVQTLKKENNNLRERVDELESSGQAKAEELSRLQEDQSKIEEGLVGALNQLGAVTMEGEAQEANSGEEPSDEPSYGQESSEESAVEDSEDREARPSSSWQEPQEESEESAESQESEDQDSGEEAFRRPEPQGLDIF